MALRFSPSSRYRPAPREGKERNLQITLAVERTDIDEQHSAFARSQHRLASPLNGPARLFIGPNPAGLKPLQDLQADVAPSTRENQNASAENIRKKCSLWCKASMSFWMRVKRPWNVPGNVPATWRTV